MFKRVLRVILAFFDWPTLGQESGEKALEPLGGQNTGSYSHLEKFSAFQAVFGLSWASLQYGFSWLR